MIRALARAMAEAIAIALVAAATAVGIPVAMATPAAADSISLDGVTVRTDGDPRQVVTVNRSTGFHAQVSFWERTDTGWTRVLSVTNGRIGYGGLVRPTRRKQGTGTTPLGTYRLPWTFGTHRPDAAWSLSYRRIRSGDFWVQDNRSAYYNRYRNQAEGGFRWWLPSSRVNASERLTDFPTQYEYAVVTDFNARQVRHRGAGIFLHVNGPGATAGCVSAPRRTLRRLFALLDPAARPVIAIGR